jgi:hypothetical protein
MPKEENSIGNTAGTRSASRKIRINGQRGIDRFACSINGRCRLAEGWTEFGAGLLPNVEIDF